MYFSQRACQYESDLTKTYKTFLKYTFDMLPLYQWCAPLLLHPQPTYENSVSKLCCKTMLRRWFDLFLYRLKRGRGEARNSNMNACISHNSASYFSSNLELDLRLVTTQHYTLVRTLELDLRLVTNQHYTLVRTLELDWRLVTTQHYTLVRT